MSKKKVVIVIVEGPSDESALGSIFKTYFKERTVQFKIVHGDITAEDYSSVDNIIKKINTLIERVKTQYGYRDEDISNIIHITDTDGTFTKGKVVYADTEKVLYYIDKIETRHVDAIVQRNEKKASILFKLYTKGKINNHGYRIYFNSCNLEHVLFDKLQNLSNEDKQELADNFAEYYEDNVEEFIEFITNIGMNGTYNSTWKDIQKENKSLERNTNMQLIFE